MASKERTRHPPPPSKRHRHDHKDNQDHSHEGVSDAVEAQIDRIASRIIKVDSFFNLHTDDSVVAYFEDAAAGSLDVYAGLIKRFRDKSTVVRRAVNQRFVQLVHDTVWREMGIAMYSYMDGAERARTILAANCDAHTYLQKRIARDPDHYFTFHGTECSINAASLDSIANKMKHFKLINLPALQLVDGDYESFVMPHVDGLASFTQEWLSQVESFGYLTDFYNIHFLPNDWPVMENVRCLRLRCGTMSFMPQQIALLSHLEAVYLCSLDPIAEDLALFDLLTKLRFVQFDAHTRETMSTYFTSDAYARRESAHQYATLHELSTEEEEEEEEEEEDEKVHKEAMEEGDDIRILLDKLLQSMYGTSNPEEFRIGIEPVENPFNAFISYGLEEEYESDQDGMDFATALDQSYHVSADQLENGDFEEEKVSTLVPFGSFVGEKTALRIQARLRLAEEPYQWGAVHHPWQWMANAMQNLTTLVFNGMSLNHKDNHAFLTLLPHLAILHYKDCDVDFPGGFTRMTPSLKALSFEGSRVTPQLVMLAGFTNLVYLDLRCRSYQAPLHEPHEIIIFSDPEGAVDYPSTDSLPNDHRYATDPYARLSVALPEFLEVLRLDTPHIHLNGPRVLYDPFPVKRMAHVLPFLPRLQVLEVQGNSENLSALHDTLVDHPSMAFCIMSSSVYWIRHTEQSSIQPDPNRHWNPTRYGLVSRCYPYKERMRVDGPELDKNILFDVVASYPLRWRYHHKLDQVETDDWTVYRCADMMDDLQR